MRYVRALSSRSESLNGACNVQNRCSFWPLAFALSVMILSPVLIGATGRTANLDDRLLSAQNRARDEIGVPALKWDPALAQEAKTYAAHLVSVGYLVHSDDDPANLDPEGENLWAGTRGYYSPEDMMDLWINEKRFYLHHLFPNVSSTGNLADVGHYTQVIWKSTTRVGCALSEGAKDDFLVCRYSEGGNVIGEMTY